MEQSSEAIEARLKEEIANLQQAGLDKYDQLTKERDLEIEKYNKKIDELTDRHKNEIAQLRENHDRVVNEIKYEFNTIIENIKQTKQSENSIFENANTYSEKLENNLQILGLNSKILIELKEKVEKDCGVMTMAREANLTAKEEEIKRLYNIYKALPSIKFLLLFSNANGAG